MSTETIKQIISRAVVEVEFRELLFADSAKALTGYDLSDEERAIFQNLSPADFDALVGNLEERISRSTMYRVTQAKGCTGFTCVCTH